MVCHDALEETVSSAAFKHWLEAGCAELQHKGALCKEAVRMPGMVVRAKQLVDSLE